MYSVNSHIHTPYSFSAFNSIEHAVNLASEQQVNVLGISDFNTVEGHAEFNELCRKNHIYPLFGIESITLVRKDKEDGVKWNDPKNPGIVYICGKALDFPMTFPSASVAKLRSLWQGTQENITQAIIKVGNRCADIGLPVALDYESIKARYAKNTVRERHVTRALFDAMAESIPDKGKRLSAYRKLFSSEKFDADLDNNALVQDQIRNFLLKAGTPCFVEEDTKSFLTPQECNQLILSGGGIPCYPVFADDSLELSTREKDVEKLAISLRTLGYQMVEFIPLRNSFDHLKNYVRYFHESGFPVVFGTEHNTPSLIPMTPAARNNTPFDQELLKISYQGACVLAAHQHERNNGRPGFVDAVGNRVVDQTNMAEFAGIGDAAIKGVIK